jgi:hypothetical protein
MPTQLSLWVTEKREALWERMEEDRRVAEVAARANAVAVGKARLPNLLGMTSDSRQARAIRLFVGAMRRRLRDKDGAMARDGSNSDDNIALGDTVVSTYPHFGSVFGDH